jgi:hypothetical protein
MARTAIIVLAAVFLSFLAIAVIYGIKTRRLARVLGPVSFPFQGQAWRQFHGILFTSPLLPIAALARDLDIAIVVAVSALAVLCFMIAFRDISFGRLSGIHKTGFVWNGTVVMFDEVASVDRSDPAALLVVLKSGVQHTIVPQDSGVLVAILTALGDAL